MRTRGAGRRSKLGALLLERGQIDQAGLQRALAMQAQLGQRLGTNLLELGLVSERALLEALGTLRHTQVVHGEELRSIPAEIIRLVPPKLAKRYSIVPVKRSEGSLLIASLDPGEALIEDEIGSLTSRLTRTVMGLEARIQDALERYYRIPAPVRARALVQRLDRGSREIVVPPEASAAEAPEPGSPTAPRTPRPSSPTPKSAATERRSPGRTSPMTATPEETSPADVPAAAPPKPKRKKVERPMYVELPEEERALIYGQRRDEALGRGGKGTSAAAAPVPADDAEDVPRAEDRSPDRPSDRDTVAIERDQVPRSLEKVAEALLRVEIRDEIADQVLAFARGCFRRRLLLMRRKDRILGWRGEGEGIDAKIVRAVDVPANEPSVFQSLMAGLERWHGPLPPFPAHETLVAGLGEVGTCVVLPIRLRDRVVSFLFGDNAGASIDDVPLATLERLTQKAGVALEVIILKNKIRVL